jgi:hypothetical protein
MDPERTSQSSAVPHSQPPSAPKVDVLRATSIRDNTRPMTNGNDVTVSLEPPDKR